MVKRILKLSLLLFILTLPVFVYAQLTLTWALLENAKMIITDVLTPLAFTLALLLFFYGIAKYIWSEGQGKEDGKKIMVWGVIALFVMSSIWGIITFIRNELTIRDEGAQMKIPTVTR